MLAQLKFELKTLILKRSVAFTVFLVPLVLIVLAVAVQPETSEGWRMFASSWAVLVVAFSIIFAVPMVVADRRERLVYKRMLTSALTKSELLIAGSIPYLLIALVQVVVVFFALKTMGGLALEDPLLLIVAIPITALAACVAGLALGAIAPSAERAQWTVLPVIVLVAVTANYLPSPGVNEFLRQFLYLMPGGSYVDLFNLSLGGTSYAEELYGLDQSVAVLPSLAMSIFWILVSLVLVHKKFRWDAR